MADSRASLIRVWDDERPESARRVLLLARIGKMLAERLCDSMQIASVESIAAGMGWEPWYVRTALAFYDQCESDTRRGVETIVERRCSMAQAITACGLRDTDGRIVAMYCPRRYNEFLHLSRGRAGGGVLDRIIADAKAGGTPAPHQRLPGDESEAA